MSQKNKLMKKTIETPSSDQRKRNDKGRKIAMDNKSK